MLYINYVNFRIRGLPPLPPKTLYGHQLAPIEADRRRSELEALIAGLFQRPDIRAQKCFRDFLKMPTKISSIFEMEDGSSIHCFLGEIFNNNWAVSNVSCSILKSPKFSKSLRLMAIGCEDTSVSSKIGVLWSKFIENDFRGSVTILCSYPNITGPVSLQWRKCLTLKFKERVRSVCFIKNRLFVALDTGYVLCRRVVFNEGNLDTVENFTKNVSPTTPSIACMNPRVKSAAMLDAPIISLNISSSSYSSDIPDPEPTPITRINFSGENTPGLIPSSHTAPSVTKYSPSEASLVEEFSLSPILLRETELEELLLSFKGPTTASIVGMWIAGGLSSQEQTYMLLVSSEGSFRVFSTVDLSITCSGNLNKKLQGASVTCAALHLEYPLDSGQLKSTSQHLNQIGAPCHIRVLFGSTGGDVLFFSCSLSKATFLHAIHLPTRPVSTITIDEASRVLLVGHHSGVSLFSFEMYKEEAATINLGHFIHPSQLTTSSKDLEVRSVNITASPLGKEVIKDGIKVRKDSEGIPLESVSAAIHRTLVDRCVIIGLASGIVLWRRATDGAVVSCHLAHEHGTCRSVYPDPWNPCLRTISFGSDGKVILWRNAIPDAVGEDLPSTNAVRPLKKLATSISKNLKKDIDSAVTAARLHSLATRSVSTLPPRSADGSNLVLGGELLFCAPTIAAVISAAGGKDVMFNANVLDASCAASSIASDQEIETRHQASISIPVVSFPSSSVPSNEISQILNEKDIDAPLLDKNENINNIEERISYIGLSDDSAVDDDELDLSSFAPMR